MPKSLWTHGMQHTRSPCPSPSPRVCSNSCPLSQWCHPTISSSVAPFSCSQSFPASGSFPVSQLFTSGGQRIGVSASVLPMNIQDWLLSGLTVDLLAVQGTLNSLLKHHDSEASVSSPALSLRYGAAHIHTGLLEKPQPLLVNDVHACCVQSRFICDPVDCVAHQAALSTGLST